MLICTGYTSGPHGGGYDSFLPRWTDSVRTHAPEANVLTVNLGPVETWQQAAHMKPRVIARACHAARNEPVVWIDVDAYLVARPTLFLDDPPTWDIGYRPMGEHENTAVCWIGPSANASDFVTEWACRSVGATEPRNQIIFEALHRERPGLDYGHVPPAYSCVTYDARDADVTERIILHDFHQKQQRQARPPMILSYYTPEYADHAKRLAESCERFAYPYYFEAMPSVGSWEGNCALKGAFLERFISEEASGFSENGGFLWLDADSEILEPLPLVRWQNHAFAVFRRPQQKQARMKFRSGTVWMNSIEFATEWRQRCEEDPGQWDQLHLFRAWEAWEPTAHGTTLWLDRRYCQKFDEGDPDEAAIVHYMASRTTRWAR